MTLILAAVALGLAILPAGRVAARPELSEAQIAGMDPEAQAELLGPLRAAAAAVDAAGREIPSLYGGVAIEASKRGIDVYLTEPGDLAVLMRAARRIDPALALASVTVRRAAYSLRTLDAVSAKVARSYRQYRVYAAYPAPDDSGVEVEVEAVRTAMREAHPRVLLEDPHGSAVEVPVTFVTGTPRADHDWNDVKWQDHRPFIGGDVLTSDGQHYCTSGLPAVRISDLHPILVTAAHCFRQGQRVYTAAGSTWAWGNGRTGSYVGTVTRRNTLWDAETLDGADNNADESDTKGWRPLTSVAYSYRGDYVCHSGARSASDGHPTPCGIKVTIDDLYFSEAGHLVRGVEGEDVNGWGSVNGDSGATVFAVLPHGHRQLRGLVSAGGQDGTADQKRVDWPEAVDIFHALSLKLNPVT